MCKSQLNRLLDGHHFFCLVNGIMFSWNILVSARKWLPDISFKSHFAELSELKITFFTCKCVVLVNVATWVNGFKFDAASKKKTDQLDPQFFLPAIFHYLFPELSIRNFPKSDYLHESCMGHFKHLERLDLFRSSIESEVLLMVLENNPKLKHLNLGKTFCPAAFGSNLFLMENFRFVLQQPFVNWTWTKFRCKYPTVIRTSCRLICGSLTHYHQLVWWHCQTVPNWRRLTSDGGMDNKIKDFNREKYLISNKSNSLREEATPSDSLKALVKGCPNLKKLFFASIRGLTDRDLENIAIYCANLEQLDLMGVMGISTDKCYESVLLFYTIEWKCNLILLMRDFILFSHNIGYSPSVLNWNW